MIQRELVLLPWLRLKESVSFGPFQFRTIWEKDAFANRFERATFRRLVQAHREITGSPCRAMTVACARRSKQLTLHPDVLAKGLERLEIAIDCLIMAGLSNRKLFFVRGLEYCNAGSFEWFRYQHPIRADSIVIWNRHRCGERFQMHNLKGRNAFRRVAPAQTVHGPLAVDARLLKSLERLSRSASQQDQVAGGILRSIRWFWHGNRDETFADIRWDVGAMASALEQLLGVSGGRNKHVKLGRILCDYFEKVSKPIKQSHQVTAEWAQKFYVYRHEPVHGSQPTDLRWEKYVCHPAMAAFVFPLALKCVLARRKEYSLSVDDRGCIDAVPKLLDVRLPNRWRDDVSNGVTRWQQIVQQAISFRRIHHMGHSAWRAVRAAGVPRERAGLAVVQRVFGGAPRLEPE